MQLYRHLYYKSESIISKQASPPYHGCIYGNGVLNGLESVVLPVS